MTRLQARLQYFVFTQGCGYILYLTQFFFGLSDTVNMITPLCTAIRPQPCEVYEPVCPEIAPRNAAETIREESGYNYSAYRWGFLSCVTYTEFISMISLSVSFITRLTYL